MRQPSITHRNLPLYIGLLLALFFVGVAVVGPTLAPLDPLERFNDVILLDGRSYIPSRNPLRPFQLDQFLLGNDNAGRDLYSRLLWAIRPTLILCLFIVTVRLLMGVFWGLMAGWYQGVVERVIDFFIGVCLAVPILLFALAIMSFMGRTSLTAFMIALSATGWASTAVFVKNSTLTTLQAPYIEGARAIGVKPWGILFRYVLPQLWPTLPSLLAFELSATLLLVAELGFLGMFIGGSYLIMGEDPNSAGLIAIGLTAGMPELGQMLSDFWSKMIRTPWEMIIVGAVVFLQIFAFNLLGEGLRRQMDVTRPGRFFWRRRVQEGRPTG